MENALPVLVPATFALLLVLERAFRARPLPAVSGWIPRCIAFYCMTSVLSAVVPAAVGSLAARFALFDLRGLGLLGSSLLGLLVAELAGYWEHRLKHRVPWIWRLTHQMHHSAERVELLGLAFFHPLDFATTIGTTSVVTALLGLPPEAAALTGFLSFISAAVGHLNVRTPRWLGYLVQRPENHSVHHARGVHAYNYGNLALWDLVFGTFRHAEHPSEHAGFSDGASRRVLDMLLGRDVGGYHPSRVSADVAAKTGVDSSA
jgi:sterol desaturase/sphingolipid hydroxylase (fatty acid hydroxylase superfamily)